MSFHFDLVLVRTESSGNIGASARALANMGGGRLILVDPRCEPHNDESRRAAAGAQSALDHVITYKSWDDFNAHEPLAVRWALTRRQGKLRSPQSISAVCSELSHHFDSARERTIFLMFGPESSGLTTSEIESAHASIQLEVFGDFQSLNLAQAVLLALYQVQKSLRRLSPAEAGNVTREEVEHVEFGDFRQLEPLLKIWLEQMGFDWRKRRSSALKTLMRTIRSSHPSTHEVHVLKSIWSKALAHPKEAEKA
jgi:TrmH family RNA methyltransferase